MFDFLGGVVLTLSKLPTTFSQGDYHLYKHLGNKLFLIFCSRVCLQQRCGQVQVHWIKYMSSTLCQAHMPQNFPYQVHWVIPSNQKIFPLNLSDSFDIWHSRRNCLETNTCLSSGESNTYASNLNLSCTLCQVHVPQSQNYF